MKVYGAEAEGCWLDCARGAENIAREVIRFARMEGWIQYAYNTIKEKNENLFDDMDMAENYLNSHHAAEGFYFGSHPDWGDWGLYRILSDNEEGIE